MRMYRMRIQGYTIVEIADELKCAISVVSTTLKRLMDELKALSAQEADAYRAYELTRLDNLFKSLQPKIEEGGFRMLGTLIEANPYLGRIITGRVFAGSVKGKRIALWGLAFKANTDDMRESPALVLIEQLLAAGATVVAHDPAAMHETERRIGNTITYAASSYEAAHGADAMVVVTDWNEYRFPDFARLKAELKQPVVVDGRNLYDPEKMKAQGFTYRSIGRGRE
jgi:UDPglucose 6-dehydrogenase